jgi:hypothetical protein
MPCTITTGRGIDCRDAVGGLRAVYVVVDASDNPVTLATAGTTIVNGEITNVPASLEAYKIDLLKGHGSFTETFQMSAENGTVFYEQVIELTLLKADHATTQWLRALGKVRCTFLAHDNNDTVYVIGFDEGAELTGGTMVTGAAKGDMHGFTVTITAESKQPALQLARTAGPGTLNYPLDGVTTDIAVQATVITPAF